jgi:hypothetical protein
VSSKIVQNEPFPVSVAQGLEQDAAELTAVKTLLAAVHVATTIQTLLAQIGNSALPGLWITTSRKAR